MMNVLFICTANVCRSPLAEGYLKTLLQQNRIEGISVSSAGVAALPGCEAFECAVEVGRQHGFDLAKHKARQITPALAHEADRILCMETWHASKIIQLDPKLFTKVALLGSFHPNRHPLMQIPDPREFQVRETLQTFDLIKRSLDGLLRQIS